MVALGLIFSTPGYTGHMQQQVAMLTYNTRAVFPMPAGRPALYVAQPAGLRSSSSSVVHCLQTWVWPYSLLPLSFRSSQSKSTQTGS